MNVKIVTFILFAITNIYSQISNGGSPYSFSNDVSPIVSYQAMSQVNVDSLLLEDKDTPKELPFRFGYGFDVSYSLDNSGTWLELPDGSRLWRLKMSSPGAYSINLIYKKFWLPQGAKFFIYNTGKTMVLGAFTSRNNKPHGKFATGLVRGDEIILEYHEPAKVEKPGEITISRIVHAYRNLYGPANIGLNKATGFGESGNCNNNVYCDEADGWEDEINSVGMIVTGGGTRLCTGALINNKEENYVPYFLTADHCVDGYDVSTWVIWFNYESSTCSNPGSAPTPQTLTGATLRANHEDSDFALLELDASPPLSYNVYYSGWSNSSSTPSSSVGIHHPSGDIKKISYDDDSAVSSTYGGTPSNSHWKVIWDDGTTEGGSSGSPLYDPNKRIVGQLHGGSASCSLPNDPDYYGKFSLSWDNGGTSATQLEDWLDPDNTAATTLDGLEDGMISSGTLPSSAYWSGTHTLTGNITVPSGVTLYIESNATITANYDITVSSGGSLVIDPGATLEFAAGKYLRIDGTLIAEGTSGNKITFDRSGGSDWGGIRFYDSSDDSKCELTYCIIDHTSSYGVYCNRANPRIEDCLIEHADSGIYLYYVDTPNARIKDNTLSNNNYGIYQYNGDTEITDNIINYCAKGLWLRYGDSKVTGNTITNTTAEGIKFDGQDGNLTHNEVTYNSGDGMYLVYYSMPLFRLALQGSNVFRNNTKNGVKIESTARPDMSAYSSPTTATNSFYANGGAYYDVYSDQSSTVYAKYNYWGPGGGSIYGNVDTSLSRDSGPSKIVAPAPTPAPSNPYAQEILDEGFMLASDEKYDEAIVNFKAVISEYPQSFEALMALRKLRTCFKRAERIYEFESYLNSIYESNKNHLLGAKVLELQIPLILNNKSPYAALVNCETIIKDFPDSEEAKHAQLTKWMIYLHETEDLVAAKTAMDEYGSKYPNDEDHILMMLTMGETAPKEAPSNDSENTQPLSFEVSDNYPNPFNPETKIQIKLPQDSDVKLQVFNIRGQVVATPFDGNLPAGSHTINFNASTLPSGVYFYKIVAGEFSDVKRMVLLK